MTRKIEGSYPQFFSTFPQIQNAQLQDNPELPCHWRQDLSRKGGNQELGRKVEPHHERVANAIGP